MTIVRVSGFESRATTPINEKAPLDQSGAGASDRRIRMQGDDTTKLNTAAFEANEFDRAESLVAALGATDLGILTGYQHRLVTKVVQMLDAALTRLDAIEAAAGFENTMLIHRAANQALAMRMHGATLRGVAGAELLESLCDAAMGRYAQAVATPAKESPVLPEEPEFPEITVDEAMAMTGANSRRHLADLLGVSGATINNWHSRGRIGSPAKVALVMSIARGREQGVAA